MCTLSLSLSLSLSLPPFLPLSLSRFKYTNTKIHIICIFQWFGDDSDYHWCV